MYAHNFHIHEVSFRVLDVDGAPPPAYMTGPKDTVYVPGKTTVRLAVHFGHHTDLAMPYAPLPRAHLGWVCRASALRKMVPMSAGSGAVKTPPPVVPTICWSGP